MSDDSDLNDSQTDQAWNQSLRFAHAIRYQQDIHHDLVSIIKELSYCLDYLSDECGIYDDPDIDYKRVDSARSDADKILMNLSKTFVTGTAQILKKVHSIRDCKGSDCVIHNPSIHSMVGWPTLWREDQRFMERICRHGVGHPDPDDIVSPRSHGCCGCCS